MSDLTISPVGPTLEGRADTHRFRRGLLRSNHRHSAANADLTASVRTRGRVTKLIAGLAIAMVALVLASASSASAATSYYGETPSMHCIPGEVYLDSVRIPTAEVLAGPVSFAGVVYRWYNNAWQPYSLVTVPGGATVQTITSGQQNENQWRMSANVPTGYYYAIMVYLVSTSHGQVTVWSNVDALGPVAQIPYVNNYYCVA